MIDVVLVAVGAAVGAVLRYLTDRAVASVHDSVFPWGTLAVNVVGSLGLGVLLGSVGNGRVSVLLGTGVLGALTTYSTFSFETLRLAESGARMLALLNAVASVVVGLGAAAAGYALGSVL